MAPPSNALLGPTNLARDEPRYPLRVWVCGACWLAQTEDFVRREEMFAPDYRYTSSTSRTWLEHCERFVRTAAHRFALDDRSLVAEIAANDGYLLQYFVRDGIPCFGVEPTRRVAEVARAKGIPIIEDFFGAELAARLRDEGKRADLIIANNVLAHVPDINDFVKGFSYLLKPTGVASFEFPHLLALVREAQFDTIYHEHYSYLSFAAVERLFAVNGLSVFDVESLTTHGGSLRVFAQAVGGTRAIAPRVEHMRDREREAGVESYGFYEGFQDRAERIKAALIDFLRARKAAGERVVAYGAAAKGNTLLNFAGVGPELIAYIADLDPAKQGMFTPGSRIPIVSPERLQADTPEWVLILPWNIRDEIAMQLAGLRERGARLFVAIPEWREL